MKIVAFAICAALLLVAAAAEPPSKVSVTMPGDLSFAFKPGAGSQAATAYCLTCHSSAYVSTQPPLDKAHWEAEVTKMRKAFGATIPDQDAAQIVDYLTATYGKAP